MVHCLSVFFFFSSLHFTSLYFFIDYRATPIATHPALEHKGSSYKPDPDGNQGDKMPVLKGGGHDRIHILVNNEISTSQSPVIWWRYDLLL